MGLIRKLHLYAGLVLAVLMLVFSVTGGALLFKDELQRAGQPGLGDAVEAVTPTERARILTSVVELFPGERVRMIRMPRDGAALYHAYLEEGEAWVNQAGNEVIARWTWQETLTGVLAELHFHLALGNAGRVLAGIMGMALALMVVTGLIIYWPFKARFSLASLLPRATTRLAWSRLHRDLGLLAAVPVLLFGLTAAGVVFPDAARVALAGLTFSQARSVERPAVAAGDRSVALTGDHLRVASRAFPAADLRSWNPPAGNDAVHYFRFRQPGEPHPNGRTAVYVDGLSGKLLLADDALAAPRGERALNWLYPLHAATIGGAAYLVIAVFAAIALLVMSISGPLIYLKGRRRPRTTANNQR